MAELFPAGTRVVRLDTGSVGPTIKPGTLGVVTHVNDRMAVEWDEPESTNRFQSYHASHIGHLIEACFDGDEPVP